MGASEAASNPFNLTGHGIVVTGGGGQLGRAIATACANAGATVLVCGRNADTLSTASQYRPGASSGRILSEVADVSRADELGRVLDRVQAEVGHLDGFVNNAYSGRPGRLMTVDRDDLAETLDRGVSDVILAVQAAALRMEGRGGAIVNIASMYGLVAPQPSAYRKHPEYHSPVAYGAAKAGVIQLTKYAACELAETGIRVNAITPGPFPSSEIRTVSPDFVEELVQRVPMRRVGEPHEIGPAVVFLLSDAASYITGHNLVIDGGWTAW